MDEVGLPTVSSSSTTSSDGPTSWLTTPSESGPAAVPRKVAEVSSQETSSSKGSAAPPAPPRLSRGDAVLRITAYVRECESALEEYDVLLPSEQLAVFRIRFENLARLPLGPDYGMLSGKISLLLSRLQEITKQNEKAENALAMLAKDSAKDIGPLELKESQALTRKERLYADEVAMRLILRCDSLGPLNAALQDKRRKIVRALNAFQGRIDAAPRKD